MKVESRELPELGRGPAFATLVVIGGSEEDLGTHVSCEKPVVIGRDSAVELPLDDASISRRHCRVERDPDPDRYLLSDLGSTNGTLLNGARVEQPVALAEGDKIFLGSSVVRFTRADRLDALYQARVEELVTTDSLTGLLAKRRFDRAFALAVEEALETETPLGVLVMDIDGLKQINDTYGHEMGGYAIVEVARIVRSVLAPCEQICRFGGDEFVAFIPDVDRSAAYALGEAIRDQVAAHRFEQNGVRVRPTISIGVAALPAEGRTPEVLFRAADRALYRAKAAGRNQVAV